MEGKYTFKESEKGIAAFNEDGETAAEITWSLAGDTILIIDHTEVKEGYNGQGLGQELVRLAVDKARRENRKVMPLCPFAAHQFAKHEEYREIQL